MDTPAITNTSTNGIPRFTIFPTDISGIAQITSSQTPGTNEEFVIFMQFTDAKAEQFHKFTREHVNQRVQFMLGARVLSEARIAAEVTNGQADLTFRTRSEAQAVANLLAKPSYGIPLGGGAGNSSKPALGSRAN